MKTTMKTLAIMLISFVAFATEAAAQKMSAAAIVDQHYAAQTATYKLMMFGLAAVYAVYLVLNMRRKREVNRFMGKL